MNRFVRKNVVRTAAERKGGMNVSAVPNRAEMERRERWDQLYWSLQSSLPGIPAGHSAIRAVKQDASLDTRQNYAPKFPVS
jgi:hypothetical protein